MSKIRIYELAKELNVPSNKLVDALADLNLNVQNHMSTIDDAVADIIRDVLRPKVKKSKKSEAAPAQAQAPEPAAAAVPVTPPAPAAKVTPSVPAKESGKPSAPAAKVTPPAPMKELGKPSAPAKEAAKPPTTTGRTVPVPPVQDKETDTKPMTAKAPVASLDQSAQPIRAAEVPEEVETLEKVFQTEDAAEAARRRAKRPTPGPARPEAGNRKSPDNQRHNRQRPQTHSAGRPDQFGRRPEPTVVKLAQEDITVGEFAGKLKRPAAEVIRRLIDLGVMASINQSIDAETATLLATEMGFTVEQAAPPKPVYDNPFDIPQAEEDPSQLLMRPPVVTVMGHVDHGKTSLLDAIRQTNVTAQEAGGITQHIGAYQVEIMGQTITFLDTPGHEAFTAMRARGAKATDIAVLVVAADDGIMPQTIEAISHAKAAGVPIIVAVNKIDKLNANPDRVKQQLTEHGLVPEQWGGETICVDVSATKRQGIDDLLTSILTLAEIAEFRANPNKPARGVVIESKIDKGRGPVATVLIHEGTLNVGDAVLAGTTYGRIRAMTNDKGRRLRSAGPSAPVELVGLSDAPGAGEPFMVLDDEKAARGYAEQMRDKKRQEEMKTVQRVSLDDLFSQIQQGQVKELRIVLKADVQGSVEAVRQSLSKLGNQEVEVKVIHDGVGPVNESDILLATASEAIIIGFNVRPDANIRRMAEQQNVDIRLYRVIYDAIEDVQKAIKGLLAPVFREVVLGQAEVRQVFKVSKVGTIAGCHVTDGKITRQAKVRLLRSAVVVFEGHIESLKRFKDDAKEVAAGYECGIGLEGFNDIKEGDLIEAFVTEQVPQQ